MVDKSPRWTLFDIRTKHGYGLGGMRSQRALPVDDDVDVVTLDGIEMISAT